MKVSTMTVSNLQLFKILKEKLGEDQAETLVEYVDGKVHDEFEVRKETFATKEDIAKMQTTIILWTIATTIASLGLFTGILFKILI